MRFWPFWVCLSVSGLMLSRPMNTRFTPGARRLLDEATDLVHRRVDLGHHVDPLALDFAHVDQAIEDRLPVLVARQVVVGDEEVVHALGEVGAHQPLDIVGVARARLASLDVDDRAEAAHERAAAAGVEARPHTRGPRHDLGGEVRRRHALQPREVAHVVVERLQLAAIGGLQQFVEASLRFPGEERDAEIHRVAKLRRHVRQHREATADVKPADADRDPGGDQRPGDVDGARKLVGLYADEPYQTPPARCADLPNDRSGSDSRVGLVLDRDPDLDIRAEHPALGAVEREAVQRRQRVRRNRRSNPLDDITLIIVMGRLDQEQLENPGRASRCGLNDAPP